MKTLFREIQTLFERTYARVGINLEECLVDTQRSRQLAALAGTQAAELAEIARSFLRAADGQLRIGIYYSDWLIKQLERNDPRAGIVDHNIRELIALVVEINHALTPTKNAPASSRWRVGRILGQNLRNHWNCRPLKSNSQNSVNSV